MTQRPADESGRTPDERTPDEQTPEDRPQDDALPDPHRITRPVELVLGTLLLAGALVVLIWWPDVRAVRYPVPGWVLGVLLLAGAVWRYAIAWRAGRD
jgi:hypothetical protein